MAPTITRNLPPAQLSRLNTTAVARKPGDLRLALAEILKTKNPSAKQIKDIQRLFAEKCRNFRGNLQEIQEFTSTLSDKVLLRTDRLDKIFITNSELLRFLLINREKIDRAADRQILSEILNEPNLLDHQEKELLVAQWDDRNPQNKALTQIYFSILDTLDKSIQAQQSNYFVPGEKKPDYAQETSSLVTPFPNASAQEKLNYLFLFFKTQFVYSYNHKYDSPSDFFQARRGDCSEFAFAYYDILTRGGLKPTVYVAINTDNPSFLHMFTVLIIDEKYYLFDNKSIVSDASFEKGLTRFFNNLRFNKLAKVNIAETVARQRVVNRTDYVDFNRINSMAQD